MGQRLAARSPAVRAPVGLAAALHGRVLESAEARGKHLLLTFDDGRTLHSHLRMSGSWHVYRAGERWRRGESSAWLVLRAGELSAVQFGGPVLELLDRSRLALHPSLRDLGPDLLGADAQRPSGTRGECHLSITTAATARARARSAPGRAIGEVLLDQSVAAGIGNIVRCEALYAARVDPWAPLGGLSDATLTELFEHARRILQAGVRMGGALPQEIYGRRLCHRCGGVVQRRGQGDEARTVHWCGHCQIVCN